MKKILIINGHPDKESFCHELALNYKIGADKSSADCKLINLIDLKFDPFYIMDTENGLNLSLIYWMYNKRY